MEEAEIQLLKVLQGIEPADSGDRVVRQVKAFQVDEIFYACQVANAPIFRVGANQLGDFARRAPTLSFGLIDHAGAQDRVGKREFINRRVNAGVMVVATGGEQCAGAQ